MSDVVEDTAADTAGNGQPTPVRRVLIAEDEALIRLDLREMLIEEGFDVVGEAGDGEKAVELAEQLRPDVVICDVKMPKVDGISLITFIREISANLPIIVFTGVGYDEERMHSALRAGANGYVSKNLPIEQLYCVLSRVLATCQQRARREVLAPRTHHVLAGAA